MNLAVLPHLMRRHMHDRLKGSIGLPRGGSLWKLVFDQFLDTLVISPINDPTAGNHNNSGAADGVNPVRIAQLIVGRYLKFYAQQAGDPDLGANIEFNWTSHEFPSGGRKDDYDFGDGVLIHATGFAAGGSKVTVTGIEPGTGYSGSNNGRGIIFVNNCGQTVQFNHNDSNSSLGYRISCPNGVALPIENGACAALVYVRTHSGPTAYMWYVFPLTPTLSALVSHKVLGDHSDSVSGTLARGDYLRANSTPKIERAVKGAAQWLLGWDANDLIPLDRRIVEITSDFTTTSGSLVDVTGLSFAVEASKDYHFGFYVPTQSSSIAGGSGLAIAVNGPASPTRISYDMIGYNTTTGLVATKATAFDTELQVLPNAADADFPVRIEGTLRNGSNAGTVIVRLRKVAIGSITARAMAGSSGWIHGF